MAEKLRVFAMTFNMAAQTAISSAFSFIPKDLDIYVLAFQEVGPFVPVICDKNQTILSSILKTEFEGKFKIITDIQMLGLKLFVAIRKDLPNDFWAEHEFIVPTGADGAYGNKGALAVTVSIDKTKMLFISAHFAAHDKYIEERNQNYADIINQIYNFSGKNPIIYHHFIYFMGDLNYRIEGTYEDVKKDAMAGRFEKLMSQDQLTREKRAMRVFNGFFEEDIKFPPTYKFNKNSFIYDTSEKKRVPSYTDRILYYVRSRKSIVIEEYTSNMDLLLSDHRPVYSKSMITLATEEDDLIRTQKKSAVCNIA